MSFSDLILIILVLAGAACILWILDINPYSKQLQVYSQTCDNMILDNTYCKGEWQNNPIKTYIVNLETKKIIHQSENQPESEVYKACNIQDRKNWVCTDELTNQAVTVKDGMVIYGENSEIRQITRLQWLQDKLLEIVS